MKVRALVIVGACMLGATLVGCAPAAPVAPLPCIRAMQAASQEATESDTLILATLDECEKADDWIAALQRYPEAGALIEYSRADAIEFLDMACIRRIDAPTCIDAAEQGLLSYELDDPRLPELQIPRPSPSVTP